MGDFFPRKYTEFGGWFNRLASACATHKSAAGLSDGQVSALQTAGTAWANAYAAFRQAKTALAGAKVTMRNSYKTCIAQARQINRQMQANPAVAAGLKSDMGLPLHDTRPTRAAAAATCPLLTVDTSQRLQHTLKWRDESTPKSRAKPKGVTEVEIWRKIGGAAPGGPSECVLAATHSRSSLALDYPGTDAGKTAYYMARWRNAHQEHGPWSETVAATIGA